MSIEPKGVSDYGGFAPRSVARPPARRRQLSVDDYVNGVLAR